MIESPAPKLLLTVEEAANELSIGRSLMYELVLRCEIRSVRVGRCRRIARPDLHAYVDRLRGVAAFDGPRGRSSQESEPNLSWA